MVGCLFVFVFRFSPQTLMERVYEFRKLAAKAKSEAVAQEKENLELKARLEQV